MSEEKFPVKELEPLALDINDIVNPSTLRAHLALLTKLKDLEQPDEQIDMRYLLRAQERYILWLDLLGSRNFNDDNMPIPPIGEQKKLFIKKLFGPDYSLLNKFFT